MSSIDSTRFGGSCPISAAIETSLKPIQTPEPGWQRISSSSAGGSNHEAREPSLLFEAVRERAIAKVEQQLSEIAEAEPSTIATTTATTAISVTIATTALRLLLLLLLLLLQLLLLLLLLLLLFYYYDYNYNYCYCYYYYSCCYYYYCF